MARDTDYEKLFAQYSILVTQNKDLQEQLQQKTKLWDEYAQKCGITDDHTRKLCEMILAKDRSEMTLGNTKTWHAFTTDELIQRAKNSYVKYIRERTELMNQIMDVAEERARKIEDLEDEIRNLLEHGGNSTYQTTEQRQQEQEAKKKEADAKEKMPYSLKEKEANGNVAIAIIEDGIEELSDAEVAEHTRLASQSEEVALTPASISTVQGKKKKDAIKDAKDSAEMYHYANLKPIIDAITDSQWIILEIISKQGVSLMSKLTEMVTEKDPERFKTGATVRGAVTNLTSRNVLETERITLPIRGTVIVIKLTEIGYRICKNEFKEKPVTPEWKTVQQEHDNLEHGYGILDCQSLLESLDMFETVTSFNRKNPYTVTIDGKEHQYIPDLLCKRKYGKGKKVSVFIEYERGKHTQPDFAMKCDKMCKVTNILYFITPNKTALVTVKKQLEEWVKLRGVENLKTITARLTTAPYLKSVYEKKKNEEERLATEGKQTEIKSLSTPDAWLLEYRYGEGVTPTKDLSGTTK